MNSFSRSWGGSDNALITLWTRTVCQALWYWEGIRFPLLKNRALVPWEHFQGLLEAVSTLVVQNSLFNFSEVSQPTEIYLVPSYVHLPRCLVRSERGESLSLIHSFSKYLSTTSIQSTVQRIWDTSLNKTFREKKNPCPSGDIPLGGHRQKTKNVMYKLRNILDAYLKLILIPFYTPNRHMPFQFFP